MSRPERSRLCNSRVEDIEGQSHLAYVLKSPAHYSWAHEILQDSFCIKLTLGTTGKRVAIQPWTISGLDLISGWLFFNDWSKLKSHNTHFEYTIWHVFDIHDVSGLGVCYAPCLSWRRVGSDQHRRYFSKLLLADRTAWPMKEFPQDMGIQCIGVKANAHDKYGPIFDAICVQDALRIISLGLRCQTKWITCECGLELQCFRICRWDVIV